MKAWRYEAIDALGRSASGLVDADSARGARDALRGRGLLPVVVEPIEPEAPVVREQASPQPRRARLPRATLALSTREFATLVGAGLTIEQGLAVVQAELEHVGAREAFAGVRAEVLAGHALASAFARFGFPPVYCALIAAGERSGRLATVLERLADHLEAGQAMRGRLLQAAVYPAVVALVALVVVAALMTFVVPQVVAVYQHGGQSLPWLTRALIAVSGVLAAAWWVFPIAAVILAGLLAWMLRDAGRRLALHRAALRIPLLGPALRSADAASLAATLSILVGGGVPVLPALEAAGATLVLLPLRAALVETAAAVAGGASLAAALRSTGEFPPVLVHLIASGEASGELEKTLAAAARTQDAALASRAAVVVAVLEPALVVALGLVVLAIVLAVMLPIIELNQLVGRR